MATCSEPNSRDPNRPPLSRESECVIDRTVNWKCCPVRNFSRREIGPLGCHVHHKAGCL